MKDYKSKYGTDIKYSDVLDMEKVGLSDPGIAEFYGITRMGFIKIRRKMGWVRKYETIRSDKGVSRKIAEEKRENWNRYQRGYTRSNGVKHPRARVGKKIYLNSRLEGEKSLLGRPLVDGEVVHHIDGDTENNAAENLMVFASQGDHMKYHNGDEIEYVAKYMGLCEFCKQVVTLENEGIHASEKYNDIKYCCSDCCVSRPGEDEEDEFRDG